MSLPACFALSCPTAFEVASGHSPSAPAPCRKLRAILRSGLPE